MLRSVVNKKVLCPLNGCRSDLASSRKGSGVLPAGRLVGLRDCTIRKAKGKKYIIKGGLASHPFVFYSFNLLGSLGFKGFGVVRYGGDSRKGNRNLQNVRKALFPFCTGCSYRAI